MGVVARNNETQKSWGEIASGGDLLYFFDNSAESVQHKIDYQDIHNSKLLSKHICGVVQNSGRPFIYIASSDSFTSNTPPNIDELCKLLACRDEKAYLAVIASGVLTLYPCLFDNSTDLQIDFELVDAPSLIRGLSEGIIPQNLQKAHNALQDIHLRKKMLDNFNTAAKALRSVIAPRSADSIDACTEEQGNFILSLLGRALFMCFLHDRGLIPKEVISSAGNGYEKVDLFTTNEQAAKIFRWQDKTFNGDFLPLVSSAKGTLASENEYLAFLTQYKVLSSLTHFINGESSGQPSLFRLLNFRHVPVGLLSEVYESFAHANFQQQAKQDSVHYTPRHIASVLVDQAFQGMSEYEKRTARVLDPSVGAGVFLVLALQKIVKEKTRNGDGISAKIIRDILYNQLRGMDINASAMRLSTLALYLAAIDLDPNPDVNQHHFDKPLIGSVLIDVSKKVCDSDLGSLSAYATPEILGGKFDLVIGNPPWTRFTGNDISKTLMKETISTAEKVRPEVENSAKELGLSVKKLCPTHNFVFPFLWKSMEWAKDNAIIAFVLPAGQVLFNNHDSRSLLFKNLKITGIVNGTDLRDDNKFWATVREPFCLLFARNTVPKKTDTFYYVNVYIEPMVTNRLRLRLDPNQSRQIEFDWLEKTPTLLKTLFRGSELDLAILEKVQRVSDGISFELFLKDQDLELHVGYNRNGTDGGETEKGKANYLRFKELNGLYLPTKFMPPQQKTEPTLLSENQAQPASQIQEIVSLNESLPSFNAFRHSTSHINAPRSESLYKPPLVILPAGVGSKHLIYTGTRHLFFDQSYSGISFANIEDIKKARQLMGYICLIFASELPKYHTLITSSRYGVARDAFLVKERASLPFISFEKLTTEQKNFCSNCVDRWEEGSPVSKEEIFNWVCDLFKLNIYDRAVIKDTLDVHDPNHRSRAASMPAGEQQTYFLAYAEEQVNALFKLYDSSAAVKLTPLAQPILGWDFATLRMAGAPSLPPDTNLVAKLCSEIADHEGCSQIIVPDHAQKSIVFGILSQYRYWTNSSARLFTQKILSEIDKNRGAWGLA